MGSQRKPGSVQGLLQDHAEMLKSVARHLRVPDMFDLAALRRDGDVFKEQLDKIEADFTLVGRVLRITFDMGNPASVRRFVRKAIRRTRNLRQATINEFMIAVQDGRAREDGTGAAPQEPRARQDPDPSLSK